MAKSIRLARTFGWLLGVHWDVPESLAVRAGRRGLTTHRPPLSSSKNSGAGAWLLLIRIREAPGVGPGAGNGQGAEAFLMTESPGSTSDTDGLTEEEENMSGKGLARLAGLACVAVLAMGPGAGAQSSNSASRPADRTQNPATGTTTGMPESAREAQGSSTASPEDKKFVKEEIAGSIGEVQLGKLAEEKGAGEDVKQFGERLVTDHTKLKEEMTPVAEQIGLTPPNSPLPKEKTLEAKLQGLSGEAFDKVFIAAMVKDHKKDLAEFKKEGSSAKSPEVRQVAEKGEPVIAEHLRLAEDAAQKHGVSTGKTTAENTGTTTGEAKSH